MGMCYTEKPEEWVQMAKYTYIGDNMYSFDFEIRGEPLVKHMVDGNSLVQVGSKRDPNYRSTPMIKATEEEAHAAWLKATNQV